MLFGTDGIRGIVGKGITTDIAYRLGRALSQFFGDGAKALVGRDNRTSGQMLEAALISGLLEGGAHVTKAGIVPSPGISFLVRSGGEFNFAVMITASHNSADYNGLKVFNCLGEKLGKPEESAVESIMMRPFDNAAAETANNLTHTKAKLRYGICKNNETLKKIYLQSLLNLLSPAAQNMQHKIVIDCANGAGAGFVKRLVKLGSINAKIICSKNDGTYINDKCGATDTSALSKAVLKHKAIAGFALDGDADRLVVVDEHGEKINGDKVIYGLAKVLKTKKELNKNTVVATIISNFGLDASLKKHDVKVMRVPVGDSNVSDAIKANRLSFGGEASGHLIFSRLPTSDGIASAIILLNEIAANKNYLHEIAADYSAFFMTEQNLDMPRALSDRILADEEFNAVLKSCEETLAKDGRILVRPSGTQELLRLLVESNDKAEGERIMGVLVKHINKRFL